MQLNDPWSNYEAINGVINSLKDHKLENYKKTLNCFKRLGCFKCNWIIIERIMKILTAFETRHQIKNYKKKCIKSVTLLIATEWTFNQLCSN